MKIDIFISIMLAPLKLDQIASCYTVAIWGLLPCKMHAIVAWNSQ